jgi:Uma2 family endonuclease
MALRKSEFFDIYPEEYLVEEDEDEMGESNSQFQLSNYLFEVLKWYYQDQNWLVTGNLELHHPAINNSQRKIVPDVMVFKDIDLSEEVQAVLTSWEIDKEHPAPPVVFEISSASTWRNDVKEGEHRKQSIYGRIGVQEYFAYDPHPNPVWNNTDGRRLLGWRYALGSSVPQPISPGEQGRLWSEVLESWLGADGSHLRLYDWEGQQRLTGSEAGQLERLAREAEQATHEATLEAERAAHEAALEVERAAREMERASHEAALEAERLARETERASHEAALEAERLVRETERASHEAALEAERLARETEQTARETAERRLAELELQLRKLQGL